MCAEASGNDHAKLIAAATFRISKSRLWFDVTQRLLCKYQYFYLTADNSHYSSANLGDGTKLIAACSTP